MTRLQRRNRTKRVNLLKRRGWYYRRGAWFKSYRLAKMVVITLEE